MSARWLLLIPAFYVVRFGVFVALRVAFQLREEDEDKARAKRFANDNGIPEEYVSVPTGRRTPRREHPEIVSRYTDTV